MHASRARAWSDASRGWLPHPQAGPSRVCTLFAPCANPQCLRAILSGCRFSKPTVSHVVEPISSVHVPVSVHVPATRLAHEQAADAVQRSRGARAVRLRLVPLTGAVRAARLERAYKRCGALWADRASHGEHAAAHTRTHGCPFREARCRSCRALPQRPPGRLGAHAAQRKHGGHAIDRALAGTPAPVRLSHLSAARGGGWARFCALPLEPLRGPWNASLAGGQNRGRSGKSAGCGPSQEPTRCQRSCCSSGIVSELAGSAEEWVLEFRKRRSDRDRARMPSPAKERGLPLDIGVSGELLDELSDSGCLIFLEEVARRQRGEIREPGGGQRVHDVSALWRCGVERTPDDPAPDRDSPPCRRWRRFRLRQTSGGAGSRELGERHTDV